MKKHLLSTLLVMGLAVSLCACGNKKDDDDKETTTEVHTVATSEEATSEETSEESSEGTLEDILLQPQNKAQLDSEMEKTKEQYKDYYSDITWDVSGNDLTYTYTYVAGVNPSDSEKEAIEAQDWDATIQSVKDSMKASIGIEPSSITYIYYLNDGTEFLKISR